MQVTRSSIIPTLLINTRQQDTDTGTDDRGRQTFPQAYPLRDTANRDGSDHEQVANDAGFPVGAIAYSPALISLTATANPDSASAHMAQRTGAAAYRAAGRIAIDHAAGHLLAASF